MTARILLALALLFSGLSVVSTSAQTRKPTAKEIAAIQNCASKHQDDGDVEDGVRECVFKLVADPCTQMPQNMSTQATADCYRVEWAIWDNLLNEKFKGLLSVLDSQQMAKLRAMQQAWIAYRDTTCNFYMDKIQGTMAIPMGAACAVRETARRAMLLQAFMQM